MAEAAAAERHAEKASEPCVPPAAALAPAARKEIKPLTTLRFFAAFAVVVNHASENFTCWHGLGNAFVVGQAVSFFFVLSGFILTYNYFHLKDAKGAADFYLARAARIWPAHLCSLFLLLALLPEVFKVKTAAMPLFLTNLFLLQAWIPSWQVFFSFNASSWSISTEMFFYLCFPLLLWGLKKRWYLPIVMTSGLVALLICLANFLHLPEFDPVKLSNQGLLYISPLSCIFNFCAGMTAALLWRDWLSELKVNRLVATVLEVGLLAGVCIMNVNSNAIRYACQPLVGEAGSYWMLNNGPAVLGFAILIMVFAMDKGWISKLFGHPFLVLLGELSFGIYMLHGVLITFLGINFPQQQSVGACLAFLTVLFVSAHLMFEIVEKPMRRLIVKHGQSIISFVESKVKAQSESTPKAAPAKISSQDKHLLRRALLLAEALALAAFVYFNLPTIHQLTGTQAIAAANNASVSNVALPPYLNCRSASAELSGRKVDLTFVWEALKPEAVSFSVIAMAMDSSGRVLGLTSYTQDGRCTQVRAGTCWQDGASISTGPGETPESIFVKVSRNKREVLHSKNTAPGDFSFTVPVTARLAKSG